MRSAVRSRSSASRAWRTAASTWPASAYQSAGSPVQLGHVSGPLLEQVGLEHVAEQVVVAVPACGGRRAGRGRGSRRSNVSSIACRCRRLAAG